MFACPAVVVYCVVSLCVDGVVWRVLLFGVVVAVCGWCVLLAVGVVVCCNSLLFCSGGVVVV